MATDHRGNPINNNNLPKTTKDRMGQSDDDNNLTFMDEEMDEDPEQIRRAEQYAQEMYDYHKPLPSDRVYGKDEMIEHDRDDDKY